jgi:hypothetical protein
MTEHESHPPAIRAEPDRIRTGAIVAVGVGSLVLFFVASLVTVQAMYRQRAGLLPEGPPPWPAEIGRNKIGIVEQRLFELAVEPADRRRAQLERLRTWGWADRKAGVLHMPIDEAMERVLRGERP